MWTLSLDVVYFKEAQKWKVQAVKLLLVKLFRLVIPEYTWTPVKFGELHIFEYPTVKLHCHKAFLA